MQEGLLGKGAKCRNVKQSTWQILLPKMTTTKKRGITFVKPSLAFDSEITSSFY